MQEQGSFTLNKPPIILFLEKDGPLNGGGVLLEDDVLVEDVSEDVDDVTGFNLFKSED